MALVWNATLSSSEKLVLLYYADRASDDGSGIWPSVNTVSQKTSLARRTIQRITKQLIKEGYLKLVGWSKYHTKMMRLNLEKLSNDTEESDNGCIQGATLSTKRGDTLTPKPSRTINKPSYKGGEFHESQNLYNPVVDSGIRKALESIRKGAENQGDE